MKKVFLVVGSGILAWVAVTLLLVIAGLTLEMLAWQPMHRGQYEAAKPLLEARVAVTRAASLLGAPGQDLRLAAALGDLAEAAAATGDPAEAERLYPESLARFEGQLGSQDSRSKHARWRYRAFASEQRLDRDHGR